MFQVKSHRKTPLLGLFLMKSHALKIMHFLHKLILSTSKMAEGAKQDVHWWKVTVLFYLIMACKERYNLCMNQASLDHESKDRVL